MERGLILLVATLVVYVSQGVQGTMHLSFSTATVAIDRNGCGANKLCRELPTNCQPSNTSTCLFASAATTVVTDPVPPSGFELAIELRGESTGYVALGLTANVSMGITQLFICAINTTNDDGRFFFRTMDRNNVDNSTTPSETLVREIRGVVSGGVIRCEFIIREVNGTAIGAAGASISNLTVLLGTGMTNGTAIGNFNVALNTGPLNLRDPVNPTGTMAPTTNGAADQSKTVLLLLSVLSLSVMLGA